MKNTYLTGGLVKRAPLPPHPVTAGQHVRVAFNERRLVRVLAVTAAVLVVVGFWSIYSVRFMPDFFARDLIWNLTYLNGEANLPALFSTLLLLFAALVIGAIAAVKRRLRDRFAHTWTGLALLAAYLGIDEGASLHEKWTEPMADLFQTGGILHYAWVIPYSLLMITVLFASLRLLTSLPSTVRIGLIMSGIVYVGGALGMELAEGWVRTNLGRENFLMEVLITIEDGLEMAGVILLISTLLRYIRLYLPGMELSLSMTNSSGQQAD